MSAESCPIYVVDALRERPFACNPASVCILDERATADWMQDVAAEMRHSETAFVGPVGHHGRRDLRWFTPQAEVDLCGHATLATAHLLWESERAPEDLAIAFDTRSGLLTARRADGRIAMDFPATPPEPAGAPKALAKALGAAPLAVAQTPFDLLVEIESAEAVAALRPDLAALRELPVRGVICTAAGGLHGANFTSRFFAPSVGIDEDPVTGSSHCALGPFWAERLGTSTMVGHQASARGGLVHVRLSSGRVELSGHAVTVLAGELRLAPSGPR